MSRVKYYPIEFFNDADSFVLCIDDHSNSLDSFRSLQEFFDDIGIKCILGAGDDNWINITVLKSDINK